MTFVPPSVRHKAFNCPHCGAFAAQTWYLAGARITPDEQPLPPLLGPEDRQTPRFDDVHDLVERARLMELAIKVESGVPVLDASGNSGFAYDYLFNVFLSECFSCKEISVWIHDKLVFPSRGAAAPPANPDLSDDIRRDYNEASTILDLSPRGAAALVRLAIQKLCKELGQPGRNLDRDIGALVSGGLDQQVQMALDVVRVVGNNAVHPGQIDLRDDRATALSLLQLLNLIADKTISQPKQVRKLYERLPDGPRKAIEERDG